MSITSGVVSVGTSPTAICTAPGSVLLQNLGSAAVTLGGPSVTTTTGVTLPATMTSPVLVPMLGGSNPAAGGTVYGVVATGTASVAFLAPEWSG